jgi:hypothetical protein
MLHYTYKDVHKPKTRLKHISSSQFIQFNTYPHDHGPATWWTKFGDEEHTNLTHEKLVKAEKHVTGDFGEKYVFIVNNLDGTCYGLSHETLNAVIPSVKDTQKKVNLLQKKVNAENGLINGCKEFTVEGCRSAITNVLNGKAKIRRGMLSFHHLGSI